ncbi:MAG TPA: HAD family phosphatase [Thermoanaerobaculia bacterium]|nr:HAD family phosphatase [Thermoanaerobaculia bacterium]
MRDGTAPHPLPQRITAVIFDFDETIIDLEPQHTAAHSALCRDLGADYQQMPESFRVGSGRRIIDDIRDMKAHFGWSESEEELFEARQRHFDDVCARSELRAMRGVHDIVRALQQRGATLAIASSAVRSAIETILTRLGLRDAFPLIVDGSEVAHGKPDPEAYLVTARKLGVAPAECVVFEDSHVGVVAAKRAGMYCIAVRNPRALERQDLSDADVIVDSFDEVDVTAWAIAR